MKYTLLMISFLFLTTGCSSGFTVNGLICPVNDEQQIRSDLASCQIYDLKAVDEAMQDKNCKACMEAKGYRVDPNEAQ